MPKTSNGKNYVKFSMSLREDIYDKLRELMEASGLDRSGAISLAIARIDIEAVVTENKKVDGDTEIEPKEKMK
jgi:hypothetical protein